MRKRGMPRLIHTDRKKSQKLWREDGDGDADAIECRMFTRTGSPKFFAELT